MIDDKPITLALLGHTIEGRPVSLTPELANEKIMGAWWAEPCLKIPLHAPPIDRHWNWNSYQIVHDGKVLQAEKVAAVTGHEMLSVNLRESFLVKLIDEPKTAFAI